MLLIKRGVNIQDFPPFIDLIHNIGHRLDLVLEMQACLTACLLQFYYSKGFDFWREYVNSLETHALIMGQVWIIPNPNLIKFQLGL